jgi:uncharacterized protein (TIGR02284 family)
METTTENDIKQLNSFLRGELSAVETYDQCIDKVDDPTVADPMRLLRESHRARSAALSDEVQRLGGEPATSSGVWGAVTKALEGSAKLFGTKAAVSVLEEGEDHGKESYAKNLDNLTADTQNFIRVSIYPEQQRSHDVLNALENRLKAS